MYLLQAKSGVYLEEGAADLLKIGSTVCENPSSAHRDTPLIPDLEDKHVNFFKIHTLI